AFVLGLSFSAVTRADPLRGEALIGYTEFHTDPPGGRHANVATMRAVVVRADGTGRRVLAGELPLAILAGEVRGGQAGDQQVRLAQALEDAIPPVDHAVDLGPVEERHEGSPGGGEVLAEPVGEC